MFLRLERRNTKAVSNVFHHNFGSRLSKNYHITSRYSLFHDLNNLTWHNLLKAILFADYRLIKRCLKMEITPVLLAGGNGTRLWPLSRKSYPKQFSKLNGDLSLFQQTALRMTSNRKITFTQPIALTSSDFRFIVSDQLQSVGIDPGAILIEPEGKNTGPAVLAACLHVVKRDPDAVLLVSPTDHAIPNTDAFHKALMQGLPVLADGQMVTFGVSPTRPETGFGYLQFAKNFAGMPIPIIRFIEKPDTPEAENMLEEGGYLWNAGIILFRARDMIDAFRKQAAHLVEHVKVALDEGLTDFGYRRLQSEAWSKCENISVDKAVMEKTDNLMVVPFSDAWSDLGDWHSIWLEQSEKVGDVVTHGNALGVDCRDVLLWSDSARQQVVGLGLEDIIAVAMPDAVLVAHKDKTQDVKAVVAELKSIGAVQAERLPVDYRPWGWFECLCIGKGFQVKRIHVKQGASLSLQSHKFRSEHWTLVKGRADVQVNDKVTELRMGESIYVPLGAVHRLENRGEEPVVLIEVQIGSYLGEDDIVRYEDKYRRT